MNFFHKYSSPKHFYPLAGRLIPWFGAITAVLMMVGLYWGLVIAPPDYQQGDSYRIMFVHVPSAWMSLFVYVVMAVGAAISFIWNIKLADVLAASSAPLGASFTLIALVTGSLWGKPMWGTWWVWDARLTSELILFFLYVGYMALRASIDDPRRAGQSSAILAMVGIVNIPIIHFSVDWWHTLHQPASVMKLGAPTIYITMLIPLIIMAIAFQMFYFTVLLVRMRNEILEREKHTGWVADIVDGRG
ncbi:MAG: heme ABC transporter permease [Acidiferrobacteraceae bacterium]|jgi:heme exporter protein C